MSPVKRKNIRNQTSFKTVFVYGDFFVLHPGHVRFLKFAASCGQKLFIGINNNQPTESHPTPEDRLETLKTLCPGLGADAFIMHRTLRETLEEIKPHIIVKGKERQKLSNPEEDWIKSWGGEIIFSSGETSNIDDIPLLNLESRNLIPWIKPKDYLKRHKCNTKLLTKIISNFKNLQIAVIGDIIIDEYIQCDALGMSREDPSIVLSPQSEKRFLGGAAIVASHAKSLGANVSFFGVMGNDEIAVYTKKMLKKYGVKAKLFIDPSRPTTLKQRYRVLDKTIARISHVRHHEISKEIEDQIFRSLSKIIKSIDVLIFSDFNYGCLTKSLIERISQLAVNYQIVIGADCQSSSQIGDISKYHNVTLLTPTEHELRIALRDMNNGLAHVGKSLLAKTSSKNAIITLGGAGVLVVTGKEDENSKLLTDLLPALNPSPIDTSGAGDSLLTSSCMALACSANPFQAAYIGSLAAGIQVARIGNIPITSNEILESFIK